MSCILDKAENRVKLLRAGFTGKEIEELAVKVFNNDVVVVGVDWQD